MGTMVKNPLSGKKQQELILNILIAVFCVASIPASFGSLGNEFDERWMYFLNFARKDEYVFGRNVFFTYGPLGFLSCVRAVKGSLFVGLAFWFFIYLSFVFLLLQVRERFVRRNGNIASLAVGLFLFLLPQRLVGDVLASFFVWLSVALLIDADEINLKSIAYALIADILVAFLFLWKTSSFSSSFTVCLLAIFMLVFVRKEYKKALFLSLSLPAIVFGYLIYNPSFTDFLGYCRGAVEISSGYNSIMGNVQTAEPFSAFFVVFGITAGVCLAVHLFVRDKKAFSFFVPFFVPLFFYYKYGIVRHGAAAFYQGVCMAFSIFFVFGLFDFLIYPQKDQETDAGNHSRFVKRMRLSRVSLAYVLMLCVLEFPNFLVSIPKNLKSATLDFPSEIIDNYLSSVRNAGGKTLDPDFKGMVGDRSVAIFPDELLYLGDTSVHFKAMPIIQNYSAYTAWLDEKNASFFRGDDAPDFILFGLEAIDMRLPLMETPASYTAIREHYVPVASNDTEILFKRKSEKADAQEKRIFKTEAWNGAAISRPEGARYLSVDMKLSLFGRLSELLWKSLPVFLDITFDDGSVNGGRVVPKTINSPVLIDEVLVPYSGIHPREDGAAEILLAKLSERDTRRAVSIDFRMKGLVNLYYKDIQLHWWN